MLILQTSCPTINSKLQFIDAPPGKNIDPRQAYGPLFSFPLMPYTGGEELEDPMDMSLPPHLDRRSGRWRSQESETMSEEGEIIS
jgi:hypothetical protein